VQQALEVASRSRTTVCIAHRLSTVKNADHIIVMSQGEIIQQGSHDELYARDGMYRGLVDAQWISAQRTADGTPDSGTEDDVQPEEDLLRRTTTGQSGPVDGWATSGVVEKTKYSFGYLLKQVLCSSAKSGALLQQTRV
jgi:ATP-binding cassette subfamily B (MDR/TAP) protein 1